VAVINETGTIGKTTVAAHPLAPRLRDAKLFAIGSVNQTTSDLRLESEKIGREVRRALPQAADAAVAITDVGATNV
jgi:hypothetical protein